MKGTILGQNFTKFDLILPFLEYCQEKGYCLSALFTAVLNGGADRGRTDDLLHAMQALCQLSYSPFLRFTLRYNDTTLSYFKSIINYFPEIADRKFLFWINASLSHFVIFGMQRYVKFQ